MRTGKTRRHIKLMALATVIMVIMTCIPLAAQAAKTKQTVYPQLNVIPFVGANSISLSIPAYSGATSYVAMCGLKATILMGGTAQSTTFSGLNPDTTYAVVVNAMNNGVIVAQYKANIPTSHVNGGIVY
jgi:uncharacterized protein (DUF1501 family)